MRNFWSESRGRGSLGLVCARSWLLVALTFSGAMSSVAQEPALEAAPVALALEARGAALAQAVELERLRADLSALAAPEMEGRRSGEGMARARAFLVERFRALGLKPAGAGESYAQPIPMASGEGFEGENLLALLEGRDDALRAEVIVLSAHYDHLGRQGEAIFRGADDNASGVAVMLELARLFSREGARPRRSILFAAFDAEERGLLGSKYFVHAPTIPLEKIALDLNLDMLGRRMLDLVEGAVFAQGWEHSVELVELVRAAGAQEKLRVHFVATDVTGARSDFAPFLWSGKPALFLSSSEHPDYHRPSDVPERIQWEELHARARLAARVLSALVEADAAPSFRDAAPHPVELETLRDLVDALLPHAEKLGLGRAEEFGLRALRARAALLLEKGGYDAATRESLMKVVRRAMSALR
ncbi:MAG: M20/M25/M40 family metallo-hydrolase [Planctomycetes bacterium]|nr:M20/M25/M40 family metallo-hydrolase [Planctomycetota bacterium]